MITKLTQKQEEDLKNHYDEYLKIGRDSTPLNFQKAEEDISALYEWGGSEKPIFYHFSSPMVCEVFINLICSSQLWDQLGDQLWDQLRGQLGENKSLSCMGTWFNGQHDSYWISLYTFGKKVGVEYKEHSLCGLKIWDSIARSCHWFYPFLKICLISDKPRKLNIDDHGRLHSYTEKAIEYSDGWGFYSVHGIVVPGWIIENPKEITVKKIEEEQNVEVRRIMLDIFGWDKYLQGVEPIHQDRYGILYRKEIPDDEPLVMVKVRNSTPEPDGSYKDYFLRVPPTTKTAHEAVAWTFGETPETYCPTIES